MNNKINILILISCLFVSSLEAQTKKKITELTADLTPTSDDILEVTNDPAGTPGSRKVTLGDFTKALVAASATDQGVVTTGAQSFAGVKTFSTSIIINEDGNDADFRIEGDTDANVIYVDASTDRVGIGTSSPGAKVQINNLSASEVGQIIKTAFLQTADSFQITSHFGANGDLFKVDNNGTVSAAGNISTTTGNLGGNSATITTFATAQQIIINDSNDDVDSRIEGDFDTTLFCTDASTDRVGIGTDAPQTKLHVVGTITASVGLTLSDGSTMSRVLTGTGTLDFGSTAAGAVADLTITVPGAEVGDAVFIGVPDGSTTATSTFTAWVSATNTVTVRFSHNHLTNAEDPASGSFRATVIQF